MTPVGIGDLPFTDQDYDAGTTTLGGGGTLNSISSKDILGHLDFFFDYGENDILLLDLLTAGDLSTGILASLEIFSLLLIGASVSGISSGVVAETVGDETSPASGIGVICAKSLILVERGTTGTGTPPTYETRLVSTRTMTGAIGAP